MKIDLPGNETLEVKILLLNNSRGEQLIDMEYNIKKEIPTAYVRNQIFSKSSSIQFTSFFQIRATARITNRISDFVFINKTINICKFFQQSSTSVILKLIYEEMTKKGLNVHSCPLEVGSYYSRGFHVSDNRFPPIVPSGRVFMKIEHLTGGPSENELIPLAIIEVIVSVKYDFAKNMRIKG